MKKDILKLNLNGKIFIKFIKFDLKKITQLNSVSSLSLNNNKKVLKIGTLTRLDKKEGFIKLIRAFSKLKTKQEVHLFICGEDHGLEQEIKKLKFVVWIKKLLF